MLAVREQVCIHTHVQSSSSTWKHKGKCASPRRKVKHVRGTWFLLSAKSSILHYVTLIFIVFHQIYSGGLKVNIINTV